jgi:uncharacterized membrane protein
VDAALATLSGLVAVTGAGDGTPWWVAAHLVERGRWVVVAALLVAVAGRIASPEEPASRAAIWRVVGGAVATAPLLWIAATWIVQATLFTLAGRWEVDGQVFLAAGYYQSVLRGYAPWLLAGAATIAVSRHVAEP